MSESMVYAIGALLICFTAATFFLSRVQTDIFPEDYEFKLDPFWPIIGVMFAGSIIAYSLFPLQPDMVKVYGYTDFALPAVLAIVIYIGYLFDLDWLTNLITLAAALAVSYLQPDDFMLFPAYLSPWQDRLAVAAILFAISKGLGLLNGLGAIASMQFLAVMAITAILSYLGILPQLLGIMAMVYGGVMLAFAFFSWPPEKLIISDGAFSALGFVMGCLMLNAAVEFSEASMFIAVSYMATEIGFVLYNRFICNLREERWFMYTSYFRLSEQGAYEQGIVRGVLKILVVNTVLAMSQVAAQERLAMPVFAVAINLWIISILSGDTKPEELLSFSNWGKKAIKGVFGKKKHKEDKDEEA